MAIKQGQKQPVVSDTVKMLLDPNVRSGRQENAVGSDRQRRLAGIFKDHSAAAQSGE